jgi:hypothetical protein
MRKSPAMTTMATSLQPVDDLILLAKESLRLFSELRRSGVPVSPTTAHALLNEATLAIEAIRTTLTAPEAPSSTLARLAPWAEIVTPVSTGVVTLPPQESAPPAKRTRRTKAEMEADAAAEAAAKQAQTEALKTEPQVVKAEPQVAAVAIAVTNPMPVEAATVVTADPSAGASVSLPESAQPGFDRAKAEAVLKKTGDEFRAGEEARREREAATAPSQSSREPAQNGTPFANWKDKLHLAPQPEDMVLPFKNGDYANRKFSECSIRDLEIVLANYVRGIESEPDHEKRAGKSLWLERGAAWHRYRFDLLLINAGDLDMDELRAEYKQKAEAPAPSASMQLHRKLWLERLEEISRVRKEHGA